MRPLGKLLTQKPERERQAGSGIIIHLKRNFCKMMSYSRRCWTPICELLDIQGGQLWVLTTPSRPCYRSSQQGCNPSSSSPVSPWDIIWENTQQLLQKEGKEPCLKYSRTHGVFLIKPSLQWKFLTRPGYWVFQNFTDPGKEIYPTLPI